MNNKRFLNLLLGLVIVILLFALVYISVKTYKSYKDSTEIKKQDKTVILDNWIKGDSFRFTSEKNLPISLAGNEYSITFLVYINDLDPSYRNTEQILFKKTDGTNDDLVVKIMPLRNNPTSDIRFVLRLQSDVGVSQENKLVFPHLEDEIDFNNNDNDNDNNNNNCVSSNNNDMNSNLVNYSNPYREELFENISGVNYRENFDNHEDINVDNDNSNSNTNNNDSDSDSDNNQGTQDNQDKEDNSNIINEKTMVDYIEVNNNMTKKVFHLGMVVYNNVVDIYKNGELVSSKILNGLPEVKNTPFEFFPDSNFNGSLTKLSYFNQALNHNEIKNNYLSLAKNMKSNKIIEFSL